MRLKKGDKIFVVSGKDKGKTGKITKALPEFGKIVVEGINIRKKHTRPKKEGQKGQVVQIPAPLDVSNVRLICEKCGKATRVGYKVLDDGKKVRTCKKCQESV
ncbi:MAG: 50S ribosomal protein L24 [Candidatus Marinimicrobia bacterium]|nr:50S ribosomal protein L24 [Candidatus Neomarinimicrobiota bacterium]